MGYTDMTALHTAACWTLKRVAVLIPPPCGLPSCPSGVWCLLRRCQGSPQ